MSKAAIPTFSSWNEQERYSWIKAPRWRGNAMEVAAGATLIAYHKGDAATVESVDRMMSALNLPLSGIQSTLGRILCRAHEAQWAAGKLHFFDKLMTNLKTAISPLLPRKNGNLQPGPTECRGVGFTSVSRAYIITLGRQFAMARLDPYQCVVPTTRNAAARADPKAVDWRL